MLFMYTDALLTEKDGTGIIDLYCNDNDKKQPRRQYKSGKRKYYIEHPFYEFLIHQIIFPVLFIFVASTFGMRPVARTDRCMCIRFGTKLQKALAKPPIIHLIISRA